MDHQWASVVARFPEAVRPSVEFVRFIDRGEAAATHARCLNGEGFPEAVATRDGGLKSGPTPPGQEEAYEVAVYTCWAKYPLDPKEFAPLTDERLGMLWDYFDETLVPCLEAEGFEVGELPSRGTFIDGYAANGWSPYNSILESEFTEDEWYDLVETCPPLPNGFY